VKKLIQSDYKVIIYGPIASASKRVIIEGADSYGTTKERNAATKIFSDLLEKKCDFYKIPFVSIFEDLIDSNYNTINDLYMDDIHLSIKALPLILKKINKTINARM
jgi:lysophospholipase L1-like esterase